MHRKVPQENRQRKRIYYLQSWQEYFRVCLENHSTSAAAAAQLINAMGEFWEFTTVLLPLCYGYKALARRAGPAPYVYRTASIFRQLTSPVTSVWDVRRDKGTFVGGPVFVTILGLIVFNMCGLQQENFLPVEKPDYGDDLY